MRRILACLLASISLLPGGVFALGLGNLELRSHLNQPFEARIELIGAQREELDTLSVRLADQEAFRRARIDYFHMLSQLRFQLVQPAQGADYIRVSSDQPIREPFLHFLVEVSWAKGRLLREYTALLDPPMYDVQRRVAAPPPPPPPRPLAAPEVGGTPVPAEHQVQYGVPRPVAPAYTGSSYGPTGTTDTLWSIASRVRPDPSISVQQMMLALLRANAQAFSHDNVNALKAGFVLRIPDRAEITAIDQGAALETVRRQHAMWEQQRAGVAAPAPVRAVGAPVAGEAVAADAPIAAEVDDSRLRLVAPEAAADAAQPAAAVGVGEESGLRDEMALLNEMLEAARQENEELRDQLGETRMLAENLQRLLDMKDDQLAALQERLRSEIPATPPVDEAPLEEPMPAEEVEPEAPAVVAVEAEPEPLAKPVAPTPAEDLYVPPPTLDFLSGIESRVAEFVPPAVLERVPGGALTALGIVILLLLLLVALLVRLVKARREAATVGAAAAKAAVPGVSASAASEAITEIRDEDITEQAGAALAAEAEQEEEAAKTQIGMATVTAAAAAARVEEPEEDPLAEVNVYLAYERFDQAEELVKQALAKEPGNEKYLLRLLEVYYAASNKAAYEETARELHGLVGGSGPVWDSAVAMWHEISPDRGLFEAGGEPEAAAPAAEGTKEFVDITAAADTGIEQSGVSDTLQGGGADQGLDFDLTPADQSQDQILDLTSGEPSIEGPDEILDLTAGAESVDAGEVLDLTGEERKPEQAADEVFDITAGGEADEEPPLDLSAGPEEAEPATESRVLDLTAGGLQGTASERGQDLLDVTASGEVEADQEGILDISAGGGEPGVEPEPEDENVLEFDISGTGFDQDFRGEAAEQPEGGEPHAAYDNALEFDLGDFGSDIQLETETKEEALPEDLAAGAEQPGTGLDLDLTASEAEEQTPVEGLDAAAAPDLDFTAMEAEQAQDTQGSAVEGDEDATRFILDEDEDEDATQLFVDSDAELPERSAESAADESADPALAGELPDIDWGLTEGEDAGTKPAASSEFDLDLEILGDDGTPHLSTVEVGAGEQGESSVNEQTVSLPRDLGAEQQSETDEVDTKLNLAKAYIELGDAEGARAILDEVVQESSGSQQEEALELLKQLDQA